METRADGKEVSCAQRGFLRSQPYFLRSRWQYIGELNGEPLGEDHDDERPWHTWAGEAAFIQEDECHTAVEGEECYKHVMWAMTTGIKENPENYGQLTASSADFYSDRDLLF